MTVWAQSLVALTGTAHPSGSSHGFTYGSHLPTGLAPQSTKRLTYPPASPLRSILGGTGILTCCPSLTPFGLGLGPTNPTRINLPSETLDLRGAWFSHALRYSCRHSHFCELHQSSRSGFDVAERSPTTQPRRGRIRSFGGKLEPRYIFGAESLDQ